MKISIKDKASKLFQFDKIKNGQIFKNSYHAGYLLKLNEYYFFSLEDNSLWHIGNSSLKNCQSYSTVFNLDEIIISEV